MEAPLTRLYPPPSVALPLKGLYLAHDLRGRTPDRPYVYTNFVASLDGRISLDDPALGRRRPPRATTNPRDWRLYLELAAQADAVLTSGRRLRELASEGRDTVRCVAETAEGDLADWRRARGLPPHPLCLALATSLDLPVDPLAGTPHDDIAILAGSDAPTQDARRLQNAGIEVRRGRHRRVTGDEVVQFARERGIRTLYAIGGPDVLHTLLAARLLDRMYLTISHLALAGREFDTLVHGDVLSPPYSFRMRELYLDRDAPHVPEQLFVTYERGDALEGGSPD